MDKPRVLSGIQPTGNLHIGNYLGAVQGWVQDQRDYDNFFCVVDLHAITVPQEPEALREQIREVAALLLAAGIDPEPSVLFVQSDVPAHSELAWILMCMTPLGWLERMHQFREKSAQGKSIQMGLLSYPVLMAADILLYDARVVPVGEDQMQHINMCRDLAQSFNARFGETLVVPQGRLRQAGARVMGLDDPTRKMSKSSPAELHAVKLLDPPDRILRKIKRAVTDSGREIRFDEARPGVTNLLNVYRALTGDGEEAIEAHFAGKGYGQLKTELAELLVETLRPLQERYRRLRAEEGTLETILAAGAERARAVADATLQRVKERVGLG